MSTELITLEHFRDVPEALLAKGKLESAGIACVLADGNLVRMDWLLSKLCADTCAEIFVLMTIVFTDLSVFAFSV